VKNLKFLFVLAPVIGFIGMIGITGCSKSNNSSPSTKDSIFYSAWLTLAPTYNTTDSGYEQTITAGHLTQSILDHGTVTSYMKFSNGTEVYDPTDFGLLPSYNLNAVDLFALGDYTGVLFRYVIIPGTVETSSTANGVRSGTARTFSSADIKSMTYAQVLKTFNIPADGASN
jgi:hypothetical protein